MYFKGLANTLTQPHPRASAMQVLKTALVIGSAVAAFLIIFQPFGIYLIHHSIAKMMVLAGYGLITFAVVIFGGIVLPAIAPGLYNRERWTIGKDLLLSGALIFFMVGLCNLAYSMWIFQFSISIRHFCFFQMATVGVGLLPFTINMLLRHIYLLRQNTLEATILTGQLGIHNDEPHIAATGTTDDVLVCIISDNGTEKLEIPTKAFVYAESADNYVKIWYEEGSHLNMKMMRLTLKKLETIFEADQLILRCHRTYMVNIDFVTAFSGNAQGLKLEISIARDVMIPVSRTMVPAIKALLNSPE